LQCKYKYYTQTSKCSQSRIIWPSLYFNNCAKENTTVRRSWKNFNRSRRKSTFLANLDIPRLEASDLDIKLLLILPLGSMSTKQTFQLKKRIDKAKAWNFQEVFSNLHVILHTRIKLNKKSPKKIENYINDNLHKQLKFKY